MIPYPKADALFLHSKKRLMERYGEELTECLYGEMIKSIGNKKCLGKKITCRKFLVRINLNGKKYFCVFDRKRNAIITFLTREMFYRDTQ